ncbi:MAG: hypothetical protein C5B59_12735 [Bacteroidetes bacterium]|nr:MAG: hypothetical protein C5B59_12735 [Bacteroidota bacterium]
MIELGDKVVDTVTRHEGIVTSIVTFLNGCRRIGIQGKDKNKETGLPVDVYYVDETTVEVLKPKVKETKQSHRGGPNDRAGRNDIPSFKI